MTDDDPRRGAPAERTREDGATPEPAAEPVVSSEPTPVLGETAASPPEPAPAPGLEESSPTVELPPAEVAPIPPVVEEATPVVEEAAPAEPPIEPSIPILSQETKYRDEPAASIVPPVPAAQEPAPPPPVPVIAPPVVSPSNPKQSAGARMREVVQAKKRARLDRVVALAVQKRVVTNNDVERLLKVSDATATNYLRELVTSGRLRRTGAQKRPRYEPL